TPAYRARAVVGRLPAQAGVPFFGASPAYVEALSRAKVVPGRQFGLDRLKAVMLAGSPVSANTSAWFYRNVKRDLWLGTGSGGTATRRGGGGGAPPRTVCG